jgi:hypothetical protein
MWGAKGQALPPWLRSFPMLRRKARSGPNRRQSPVGTGWSLASRVCQIACAPGGCGSFGVVTGRSRGGRPIALAVR